MKWCLLIVKVLQRNWHLILSFLIEDDLEGASVIIDLEAGAHGFIYLVGDTSDNDDLDGEGKRLDPYWSVDGLVRATLMSIAKAAKYLHR